MHCFTSAIDLIGSTIMANVLSATCYKLLFKQVHDHGVCCGNMTMRELPRDILHNRY